MERLDKLLAARGVGTRQDARRLCKQRRVSVAGVVITDSTTKIDPSAILEVHGQRIDPLPRIVLYHKPVGVVSSMDDDWDREDLSDVLPERWRAHLHPVGRLDADTSGLLLFSHDGQLTQRLLHPKRAVEREYLAHVQGLPSLDALRAQLAQGVQTAEGLICAHVVRVERDAVQLIVTEGKHRMVRRVLANCGYPVLKLHRLRYGPFSLGSLPEGAFAPADEATLAKLP